jgi:glycine/D-amino acid oxidase-like deaminating enzyme
MTHVQNGGHCQPLLFDRSSDVAAFELKNVDTVRSYIEANKIPCEWRSVSGCRSFWTEEVMNEAERELAHLTKVAPHIADRVTIIKDKDELKNHRVNPECVGATLTAGAGTLWPYKLVTYTLEKLIRAGRLNLQTNTPVTGVTTSSSEHIVQTPRGSIMARTVILATNGYTSAILPQFADLIVPVRGEMSALIPPKNSSILPDSHGMVAALGQAANNDDYLIQRPYGGVPNPAGHLMFGGGRGAGTLPTVGVSDDSIIDEGSAAYLRSALLKVLILDGETEGLTELEAAAQWTGIMGYSRDNHPWVGKVPDKKGLWLCGGYTGHGMPNGTLCAKAVVDMLLADETGEDLPLLQETMIKDVDIPKSYLISEERIASARSWPTVEVQDRAGMHMTSVV